MTVAELLVSPVDVGLSDHQLSLSTCEMRAFEFIQVKTEAGGTEAQLRFVVRVASEGCAAQLEAYWNAVGSNESLMKIQYEFKDSDQTELQLSEAAS